MTTRDIGDDRVRDLIVEVIESRQFLRGVENYALVDVNKLRELHHALHERGKIDYGFKQKKYMFKFTGLLCEKIGEKNVEKKRLST